MRKTKFVDAKILGDNIRAHRVALGLSQTAFAQELGIKQSSLSSYEGGTSLPTLDLLVQLSGVFKVSIDDLLGNTVPAQNKNFFLQTFDTIVEWVHRSNVHFYAPKFPADGPAVISFDEHHPLTPYLKDYYTVLIASAINIPSVGEEMRYPEFYENLQSMEEAAILNIKEQAAISDLTEEDIASHLQDLREDLAHKRDGRPSEYRVFIRKMHDDRAKFDSEISNPEAIISKYASPIRENRNSNEELYTLNEKIKQLEDHLQKLTEQHSSAHNSDN